MCFSLSKSKFNATWLHLKDVKDLEGTSLLSLFVPCSSSSESDACIIMTEETNDQEMKPVALCVA